MVDISVGGTRRTLFPGMRVSGLFLQVGIYIGGSRLVSPSIGGGAFPYDVCGFIPDGTVYRPIAPPERLLL